MKSHLFFKSMILAIIFVTFSFWRSVEYFDFEHVGPYLDGTLPKQLNPLPYDFDQIFEYVPQQTGNAEINRVYQIPGTSRILLLGKRGRVWSFEPGMDNELTLLMDISDRVMGSSDAGLLGVAFHPGFEDEESPGHLTIFFFYTFRLSQFVSPIHDRLSRFQFSENLMSIQKESEQVVISQYDRNEWHNGGAMFFDNEGFLYVALGDEGLANDAFERSQKIDEDLFSGVIRIDIDQDPDRSHPIRRYPLDKFKPPDDLPSINTNYTIPNSNPWVNEEGDNLEEFFAIGLRSPHSIHYDPVTEQIFVADVGQSQREEITVITSGSNGQWSYREGEVEGPRQKPNTVIGIETPPIHTYGRNQGIAIIGGGVYRGSKFEELNGKYLFGDYGSSNIWSLNPMTAEVELISRHPSSELVDFLFTEDGDIIILTLKGNFFQLKEVEQTDPPQLLSDIYAFTNLEFLDVETGILPFDVNTPLWSDGAEKKRWVAIPGNSIGISFRETGAFSYPPGTVFIKHFEMNQDDDEPIRLETRFLVIDEKKKAYGLTYMWNDEGTEAFLIPEGETPEREIQYLSGDVLKSQTWTFPSRSQCINCHNRKAGFVLGARSSQLNRSFHYSNGASGQLEKWNELSFFDNDISSHLSEGLISNVSLDDQEAGLELRFRSYIDANCSFCHHPEGVDGAFDARLSTSLEFQKIINQSTQSRNSDPNNRIVFPQAPEKSEIWLRDNSTTDIRMPPIGKSINDDAYLELLIEWINSLENPPPGSIEEDICEGSDYTLPDGRELENISFDITDTSIISSKIGLDSMVITNLNILPLQRTEIDSSVCIGNEFLFPDSTRYEVSNEEFAHTSYLEANNSCDSLVTINIIPALCEVSATDHRPVRSIRSNHPFKAYPNPFKNLISLEGWNSDSSELRLIDMSGNEIPIRILSEGEEKITIHPEIRIENGLYFLSISNNEISVHLRMLRID